MDFEEIFMVIPNLEFAADCKYGDIAKRQNYQPQMYNTHLTCHEVPKGGKYIVIIRQGLIWCNVCI